MVDKTHDIQTIITPEDYSLEIERLAKQYQDASGVFISLANYVGSKIEKLTDTLPDEFEQSLQNIIKGALEKAYDIADNISGQSYAPTVHNDFYKVTATASGAITGIAGVEGAAVDLPIVITTMFGSFQKIASQYGFERSADETKLECLKVFSMDGPLNEDEELDLSFVDAKLTLTDPAISDLIAAISQRLAVIMGQKLGASAVPILGAISGAAVNYAFMAYYEDMAHIRFRLKQLQNECPDADPVSDFVSKLEEKQKLTHKAT